VSGAREHLVSSLLHTLHENTKVSAATLSAPTALRNVDARPPETLVPAPEIVPLPAIDSPVLGRNLVDSILRRRSVRRYRRAPLPLDTLGRLLFFGTAPDLDAEEAHAVGAIPPLVDVYTFLWSVDGLAEGTYRYDRGRHGLIRLHAGPDRGQVSDSVFQPEFATGTGVLLLVADLERANDRFGPRGYRYALMQAGSLGEAFYLVATALGVGISGNGGFRESTVQRHCGLDGLRRDLVWTLPFGPNEVVE
jgi:SagB-type dehydrogenase family enzyme